MTQTADDNTPEQPDPNRAAIADLIKQFILLITGLAFANAFGILVRPPDLTGKLRDPIGYVAMPSALDHLGDANGGVRENVIIFLIFIVVGTRFLVVNWLYLTATYGESNGLERQPSIIFDAIGVFLTGIGVGVLGFYATITLVHDFFVLLIAILLFDATASGLSLMKNRKLLHVDDKKKVKLWTLNNAVVGLISILVIWGAPRSEVDNFRYYALMAFAVSNCLVSVSIAYFAFFSSAAKQRRNDVQMKREAMRPAPTSSGRSLAAPLEGSRSSE
jgi:hypothetical protein